MKRIFPIAICLVAVSGCATRNAQWAQLAQTARSSLDKSHQQTQFAVIGELRLPAGKYHVAVQHAVTTGMLAPRGHSKLMLFDSKGEIAATYTIMTAKPLWCEGARIYLAGTGGLLQNVPVDPKIGEMYPDSAEGGNVIDFSKGVDQPVITREKRYGSSGGIEDDPWRNRKR